MSPRPPTPDAIRIGLAMADARNALGLTQEEVGARLGVDANTVSRWEQGENRPKRSTAGLVEQLYRLPPGSLTGGVPVGSVPRGTSPLHTPPSFPAHGDAAAGVLWAAEQMSETVTRLIREARGLRPSASTEAPGLASTDAFGEAPPGLPDQAKRQG